MDEIKKLEAEKLVVEIEEAKQRIKNELLREKLLTLEIQNIGLMAQKLTLEINKIGVDIRAADGMSHAYDEMENYYVEMKDVAKYKKEVWFARVKKEAII